MTINVTNISALILLAFTIHTFELFSCPSAPPVVEENFSDLLPEISTFTTRTFSSQVEIDKFRELIESKQDSPERRNILEDPPLLLKTENPDLYKSLADLFLFFMTSTSDHLKTLGRTTPKTKINEHLERTVEKFLFYRANLPNLEYLSLESGSRNEICKTVIFLTIQVACKNFFHENPIKKVTGQKYKKSRGETAKLVEPFLKIRYRALEELIMNFPYLKTILKTSEMDSILSDQADTLCNLAFFFPEKRSFCFQRALDLEREFHSPESDDPESPAGQYRKIISGYERNLRRDLLTLELDGVVLTDSKEQREVRTKALELFGIELEIKEELLRKIENGILNSTLSRLNIEASILYSKLLISLTKARNTRTRESWRSMCNTVEAIEKRIADEWKIDPSDLNAIYAKAFDFFEESEAEAVFLNDSLLMIRPLLLVGTDGCIEKAIQRLDAIKNLYRQRNGVDGVPKSLNILSTQLQIFAGNIEGWTTVKTKRKKRNRRRGRRRGRAATEAKSAQEALQQNKVTQERAQKAAEAQSQARNKRIGKRNALCEAAAQEKSSQDYHLTEARHSEKAAREARAERHRAAEQERASRASGGLASPSHTEPGHPSPAPQEQETLASTATGKADAVEIPENISKLFSLKEKTPRSVEWQISSGGWKFNRIQLIKYFEALGCKCHEGSGSHTKMQLPKSPQPGPDTLEIFSLQGEIVGVVTNQVGGSLTLPGWEQNHVPYYFRKQILAARERLARAKLQEIQRTS